MRSLWRADVTIHEWDPQFEIPHRLLVPTSKLTHLHLGRLTVFTGIHLRALVEAGIQVRDQDRTRTRRPSFLG